MRDDELYAVVARSTFPSQNVQNTSTPDHFWKLRCRKSARCCGAKHISKSKCTRHTIVGLFFGSCDAEKVHAIVARSTFRSQHVKNTRGSDHFWRFRCRFAWQAQGIVHLVKSEQNVTVLKHFQLQPPLHHYTTLHSNTLHYTTTITTTTPSLHSTTLHSTTLHSTKLHYTTLHYTTLHSTTLRHTTLHYTTLHYTPLHYTTLHYTTLRYTTLHYTSLHYTTLHSTTLHYTTTTYSYTTTLHYTPLH